MNVLFVGDIVGPAATEWAGERIRQLRKERDIDLVIANGENCGVTADTPWQGFGLTRELLDLLLESGVDVVTSGNHGWDGPDVATVHEHPRVLRPLNAPPQMPGGGVATVEVAGESVSVVNLADAVALNGVAPVYATWRSCARMLAPTVVVDFHGDSTWEKMIFATAVDGEVAAVLGTHTHEPTHDLHLLPKGTAFVADVGMTAATGSLGGFSLDHFARRYRGESWDDLPPFEMRTGPFVLGAVIVTVVGGRATAIERVQ
jgi:2',3'-cyclic-nucleotide 2'-phosphodiesterase